MFYSGKALSAILIAGIVVDYAPYFVVYLPYAQPIHNGDRYGWFLKITYFLAGFLLVLAQFLSLPGMN